MNQNQLQFIKIVVWGEDWITDTVLEITEEKPIQYWVSSPKSIQTEMLDKLVQQLENNYPEATFIDSGYEIILPTDYEPVEPIQEFDKRLKCLYSTKF